LPALQEKIPRRLMERLNVLMELSSVMATERPFPSDITTLLPNNPPLQADALHKTLGLNLKIWGEANNHPFQTQPYS